MIDWNRVSQLRDEVGDEAFAEIAAMFLSEVDAMVRGLDAGAGAQRMASDMHAIKGSALNLGFSTLADLSARGESDANAGQPGRVDIAAIRSAFAAARQEFVARFPELG